MTFSKAKELSLKPQKSKLFLTFLLAMLTATAFFVPYMIMSDGYFTFFGDFNVQQITFYKACHKAIKEGNIFWSHTTDLGANFIGSYSFYLLGSPFFLITLPFKNSFVPYLMGPLLILKFGCAASTAYLYIKRFTRTTDAAMLGGLLYAFSGFSIYNIFFNHFHEAIIVFPLLLLSFELLITENRRFVFAFMVFLCAVTNYFFFFGMVVFTVIYFFVRLLSGSIKIKFSHFLTVVFEAALGVAMSAFLLLPSILAISGNSRISSVLLGWNAIMYGKEQIYGNILQCFFFPPDIPARPVFFPNADVKWSSLGGWLPLFSMVGLFTFFSKRKGHWIKRVLGICIFMALVPILNSAFYAFNVAYYARWYYMPILLICLGTVILTEDADIDWSFGYNWVTGITVAASLIFGFFPQQAKDGRIVFGLFVRGSEFEDIIMYFSRFWIACGIAIASLLILKPVLKLLKTNRTAFYNSAIAFVCIITIIYANVFISSGRSHSPEKEILVDQFIEGEVDLDDGTFFRTDVYEGLDNTSMALGLPGINAFHSIVPASVMEFYDYLEIERTVASRPGKKYVALRPLLSVKYLLDNKRKTENQFTNPVTGEDAMTGYKYRETQCNYNVYENENYVPMGFSYDYYMSESFCNSYKNSSRANLMLKAMLLNKEQIKKYGDLFDNLKYVEDYNIFEDDECTTLSLSESAMEYDCKKLAKTAAKSFKTDNKGFSATVERDKDCLVFFSIPYDEGWSATVNGKKAEIEKVNVGFMAVKVEKGTSKIRFNYMTPGLKNGILITVGSAALFLLYIIVYSVYKKIKTPKSCIYPEGDELLKEWRMAEINELNNSSDIYVEPSKKSILDVPPDNNIFIDKEKFDGGFQIDLDSFKDN